VATDLDALDFVEIRGALRDLNADFAYFLDHGDIAALVNLFTEDALYVHGERRSVGRAAIEELFRNRAAAGPRTSRHVLSGLRLQIHGRDRALGSSVCLTFAGDGVPPLPATPYLVADFNDRYARSADDRWRIAERRIDRIFVGDGNPGPIGLSRG
jgi:ketosteroid isomerase-like protein